MDSGAYKDDVDRDSVEHDDQTDNEEELEYDTLTCTACGVDTQARDGTCHVCGHVFPRSRAGYFMDDGFIVDNDEDDDNGGGEEEEEEEEDMSETATDEDEDEDDEDDEYDTETDYVPKNVSTVVPTERTLRTRTKRVIYAEDNTDDEGY